MKFSGLELRFCDYAGIGSRAVHYELMFVHGMWSSAAMFDQMMLDMSGRLKSFAMSLRDHGKSALSGDPGKVSIEDYIDDVQTVISGRGVPVILVGHSMGALITNQVAARDQKNLVVGHVALMSAPTRGVAMGWQTIKRIPKYIPQIVGRKPFVLNGKDAADLLFNTNCGECRLIELISSLCHESGRAAWDVTTWKYKTNRLAIPALHIAGTHDAIVPHQRWIAKASGARYEEVPTGHMVMLDPLRKNASNIIVRWTSGSFK